MAEVIWRNAIKRGVLALLLMAMVAPAGVVMGKDNRRPDLSECENIEAPRRHKVAFVAYAEGVQIYRWNGTAWSFIAPEALLYSGDGEKDEVVGIHYAGPTWEITAAARSSARSWSAALRTLTPFPGCCWRRCPATGPAFSAG